MLRAIRIVKEKDQWKLIFDKREYHIGSQDSKVMNILKPKSDQVCVITDLTSENAVCYFLIEEDNFKVFSYPDDILRVTSQNNLGFFKKLKEGVKYYLIPVL